ncbi:MAG: MmgE/PrpD family protein [Pseudomonadota bacterium]
MFFLSLSTGLIAGCDRPVASQDLSHAAKHLLDWLGTVIATRGTKANVQFGEVVGASAGAVSTLRTAGDAPEKAAFALGALGSLLEMDDLDRTSILHAGDTVCPAALCAALETNCSGPLLLTSLLKGYEISIRIGRTAARGGYTTWYNSSACGVFGAAMAASCAKGLTTLQSAHALGHAGMQASGLWQARLEPGFAKQMATAHAARAGISAARAAEAGLAAPLEILEGNLGFFKTFFPEAEVASVLSTHSTSWLLHQVSLKPWSACRHTHPAIAAALDLQSTLKDLTLLRDILVVTYGPAISFCDRPDPQNAHEARFSLQHCVALALYKGAPERADFEEPARRNVPALVALREKITLSEDPEYTQAFPVAYPATVEATDQNGHRISVHAPHAPGDPEAPLTDAEVTQKFVANCHDGGIPPEVATALQAAVRHLPDASDLSGLRRALNEIPMSTKARTYA